MRLLPELRDVDVFERERLVVPLRLRDVDVFARLRDVEVFERERPAVLLRLRDVDVFVFERPREVDVFERPRDVEVFERERPVVLLRLRDVDVFVLERPDVFRLVPERFRELPELLLDDLAVPRRVVLFLLLPVLRLRLAPPVLLRPVLRDVRPRLPPELGRDDERCDVSLRSSSPA